MELESLKGSFLPNNAAITDAQTAAKKSSAHGIRPPSSSAKLGPATVGATTASSGSDTSTTSKPITYVKKPENEETPALSDNANSLKYGGENAEIEEALANMAHIPPSKGPSLSVSSSSIKSANGGIGSPLGDSIIQQEKSARTPNGMGLLSRAGGINLEVDYTPQDIAEYIFWMGDERGVELAINDFVQDGLVTPQDAIKFLEDVKAELNSVRNRYTSTVALGHSSSPSGTDSRDGGLLRGSPTGRAWDVPVQQISKKQSNSNNLPSLSNVLGYPPSYNSASAEQLASLYSSSLPSGMRQSTMGKNMMMNSNKDSSTGTSIEDLDYEEIVEKLRQADTKMREYMLEGIIYQLARELFSTGLQQSPGTSVPAFTNFIENLAVNGNISKDLERSVLETLVQALVDAANERGLLVAKSAEGQMNSLPKPVSDSQKPILLKKKSV
ncbi:unnamed protein product [Orchesella dallaii]|uniref:Uncharacterized protein n=1 Tax=Orchesella dallaii TaxID=48710 RepID=A0ABP1S1W3_9HEXA